MKDKEYLTTGEAAKYLFRSRGWVREQIRQGKIQAKFSSSSRDRVYNQIHIREVERVAMELYSSPKVLQDLYYKCLAKLLGISYKQVKKGYGAKPKDKE